MLGRISVLLILFVCIPADARTALAASSVPPTPRRVIQLTADLHLREIGPGAWVVAHRFPFLANSALVEMPDGTFVLVGTPWTPDATAVLLRWLREEFGQRRVVAINTGYHVDNLGGNRALLDAGISVYGSDRTVTLLRERGEQTRQIILRAVGEKSPTYATHATMPFFAPDHIFPLEAGLVLTFGGDEVRVLYYGPSQAPDKVAVYFPSRRLLFGGCMVIGADRLGNTAEADIPHWIAVLRRLERLPAEVVVPGHSDRLEPGLIRHTLKLLEAAAPR